MIANPVEKKNQLLADLNTNKITQSEFDLECAMWYLECFDEINRKPYPTMPQDYKDYLNMPFDKRNKVGNDFWQNYQIKTYLEQKEKIKNENSSHLYWLKEYLTYLPEQDFVSRNKFDKKIREFEGEYFP